MDIKLHKKYQDIEESHWWFKVRDNLLKDVATRHFKLQGLILDFGCNFGHAVRLLSDWGYRSEGVDISEEAINYGKSIGISGLFLKDQRTLTPDSFDGVIAMDVLEHIEDDLEAVRHLKSVLRPGGTLVLTVPAFMMLWGVQDVAAHHFRRYSMTELENLISKVGGFEIVKKSYFNTFLFLPIAAVRILSRIFNLKARQSDFELSMPVVDKIFFSIFDFERKFLNKINFPFGVSILIVLKKK